MKMLVTGHCGFVGAHLVRRLEADGAKVVGCDLRAGGNVVWCSLPDDIDRVFHLAAETDAQAPAAMSDAMTNILGSIRIFERYGDRVVLASSSMVQYPLSPYAISKRAAEDYARYFGAAIVRFCNLFGEGGHSVMDKFRESERIVIRGTGQQLRTYAPVEAAVEALLAVMPGETMILPGVDYTVNQIADMYPAKPVEHVPAGGLDLMDARQVA